MVYTSKLGTYFISSLLVSPIISPNKGKNYLLYLSTCALAVIWQIVFCVSSRQFRRLIFCGSFVLIMSCVCHAFVSVDCCLVVIFNCVFVTFRFGILG